ncbi:hypothetical protein P0G10_05540 [Eubacteriales bacterium DFI.9.88]|nr:hypothetical protein [Eubacteriales bacterium DFI.9.88]
MKNWKTEAQPSPVAIRRKGKSVSEEGSKAAAGICGISESAGGYGRCV